MKYYIYNVELGEIVDEVLVNAQVFFRYINSFYGFDVNKDWLPTADGHWILEFYHNDFGIGHIEVNYNPYEKVDVL